MACLLLTGRTRTARTDSGAGIVVDSPSKSPASPPTPETSGEDAEFNALAESCYRFTPQIAIRRGEAVFLDITGCAKLYSEKGLTARLGALATRFGWKTRIEIAENASTALALARFQIVSGGSLGRLPLEALMDVSSPFRPAIERQAELLDVIRVLKTLGVRNIAGFLKLPSEMLASRFGREITQLAHRLRGELDPAWPGFHPAPGIHERADINEVETQEGVFHLDPILFGLKILMDRGAARLRGRGERAAVIRVGLELHAWSTVKNRKREWRIELPLPQGSVLSLLAIVKEHLSMSLQREPLAAPVKGLDFEILETVPGLGAQRDFFSQKEEDAEAWNALVGRLAHKLGNARVFIAAPVARFLPEASWRKTLRTLEELAKEKKKLSALGFPERPTRLLTPPERLRFVKSENTQTRRLECPKSGQHWMVLQWRGPERICGEWWRQTAVQFPEQFFDRDYYQVLTESGERLWVFVDRGEMAATPGLYLHGYF